MTPSASESLSPPRDRWGPLRPAPGESTATAVGRAVVVFAFGVPLWGMVAAAVASAIGTVSAPFGGEGIRLWLLAPADFADSYVGPFLAWLAHTAIVGAGATRLALGRLGGEALRAAIQAGLSVAAAPAIAWFAFVVLGRTGLLPASVAEGLLVLVLAPSTALVSVVIGAARAHNVLAPSPPRGVPLHHG